MNVILFLFLLVIVFVIFAFLVCSFLNWRDGYKDAGVKMSFGEFRRIYELAPSKWDRHSDYTYHRNEWIQAREKMGNLTCRTYVCTSIAMKTLLDFWRLLLWQKGIDRKKKREERFKNEKVSLRSLSIIIENDAENIRRKLEKEEQKVEELRQEIIDRLGGNK